MRFLRQGGQWKREGLRPRPGGCEEASGVVLLKEEGMGGGVEVGCPGTRFLLELQTLAGHLEFSEEMKEQHLSLQEAPKP